MNNIAIVHGFNDSCGGTENEAIELYSLLRTRCSVELWALGKPDPYLSQKYPIRRISFLKGQFPRGAHLVFPGASRVGRWIYFCSAGVVSLIANTVTPRRLERRVKKWRFAPKKSLRIFYVSRAQQQQMPLPGTIITSPVDVNRFRPAETAAASPRLTVGRMSRDVPYKHGREDPALYRYLVKQGWAVSIRGGTCLSDELGNVAGVELSPASPDGVVHYLQGLDVFFYRTRDDWFESFGRVILEAMASGVVVVADRRGGYADVIDHGQTGFLFDTNEEAIGCFELLKSDPEMMARMKLVARAKAMELVSDVSRDRLYELFTAEV